MTTALIVMDGMDEHLWDGLESAGWAEIYEMDGTIWYQQNYMGRRGTLWDGRNSMG